MILSDISVKRPVFATVLSLLLIAFGALSFQDLPVREFPDIDVPVVSVVTSYPGASAQVVENRITRVIEDMVSGIQGIKSLSSSSSDGRSSVVVEFDLDRNMDNAANDIRERLGRVIDMLPQEVRAPEVLKVDADSRPIVWFNLSSPVLTPLQLNDFAERVIVDRLSVVKGVARVRVGGNKRYAMRIWLDRTRLASRGMTVPDVERALRSENVELPAGRVETAAREFTVRVERNYNTPDDFRALVLGQGSDGHLIRLGEVADIEIAPEEVRTDYRGNGESSIGIGIVKQSKANTLDVARAAKAEVVKMRNTLPPSMTLHDSWDSSVFVEEAIDEVYRTLFIAIGLVVFVIYLFLGNVRAALVPAVTVPVCLIGTFLVLDQAGYSLNMLTLLALVLSIGLVVDDAIVVLENIYRRVENGEPKLLAAYRGARQVAFAVIATTLVLIGVFMPVIFLDGPTGRIFAELSLTLAAAVGISSVVALSLSPMMCSKILSRKTLKTPLNMYTDALFKRIENTYRAALHISFKNKAAVFLLLVGAMMMIVGLLGRIPSEFTPQEDRGGFMVMVRGPEGASFDETHKKILEVEAILMEGVAEGTIRRLMIMIPGFGGGTGSNSGMGIVILPSWLDREVSTQEMVNWTRKKVSAVTGVNVFAMQFRSSGGGGGGGNPVQFVVGGNTYEDLAAYREILLDKVRENPRLINVDIDYQETKPQFRLVVDRDRAADLGVPVEAVGRTLETMLGSRRVTTFMDRGEEYDVLLQASRANRDDPSDISNLYVRSTQTSELIPLSSLVKMTEVAYSGRLNRYNKVRALTLSASLAPDYTLGEALDYLENMVNETIPDAASIDFKGESRELKETSGAIYFAFITALVVVFLILAAQFESFIHPVVIMLTVPLAVAGGLFGLYAMGSTFNIYSQVGMIILIGLAAKNGILIVEFANQLRDDGRTAEEAVVEASVIRLRPIMMTGISTAIGALPLVLAMGPGSVSRGSIGIVILSGVLFSTLLTLFIIPVFYRMLAPYTTSPGHIAAMLRGQITERETPPAE